jgi:murein L,D-transpeptidase YafK
MKEQYKTNTYLLHFWDNLKTGYDKFYKDFEELSVRTDPDNGRYVIQ